MNLIKKHHAFLLLLLLGPALIIFPSLVKADMIQNGGVLKQPRGAHGSQNDTHAGVRRALKSPKCKSVGIPATNIAMAKVSQKSVYKDDPQYGPVMAIDGDTRSESEVYNPDNNIYTRGIIRTEKQFNPYWQIDLGQMYPIDYIRIHNRDGGCPDHTPEANCGFRLRTFVLEIMEVHVDEKGIENENIVWYYEDKKTPEDHNPGDVLEFGGCDACLKPFDENTVGNRVKLRIPKSGQILHIRELEVFVSEDCVNE